MSKIIRNNIDLLYTKIINLFVKLLFYKYFNYIRITHIYNCTMYKLNYFTLSSFVSINPDPSLLNKLNASVISVICFSLNSNFGPPDFFRPVAGIF